MVAYLLFMSWRHTHMLPGRLDYRYEDLILLFCDNSETRFLYSAVQLKSCLSYNKKKNPRQ